MGSVLYTLFNFWPFSNLDERILHDCLRFIENHLEKPTAKIAFEKFFTEEAGEFSRCFVPKTDLLIWNYCAPVT